MSMPACKFTFDGETVYEGFAHGSTWNGFDNVAVTKETLDQLIKESAEIGDEETVAAYRSIKPMLENDLYSLGFGFATEIVRD